MGVMTGKHGAEQCTEQSLHPGEVEVWREAHRRRGEEREMMMKKQERKRCTWDEMNSRYSFVTITNFLQSTSSPVTYIKATSYD